MPSLVVKSFAKKYGKSVDEVEKLWDRAKAAAFKSMKQSDPNFWATVVAILKKMVKAKTTTAKEMTDEILSGSTVDEVITTGSMGILGVSPKALICPDCKKKYIDTDVCPYCGITS